MRLSLLLKNVMLYTYLATVISYLSEKSQKKAHKVTTKSISKVKITAKSISKLTEESTQSNSNIYQETHRRKHIK